VISRASLFESVVQRCVGFLVRRVRPAAIYLREITLQFSTGFHTSLVYRGIMGGERHNAHIFIVAE
jgi:hypothetical protein